MLCWSEPLKQPEQHNRWRASSKSWTSSMFESMQVEDWGHCTFYSPTISILVSCGSTHFFDYNHVIFLLLQFMYTSTRYFKQHSSLKFWTEQLKTFMYDGQFEQVMHGREILFVWHAFSFRFLNLEVSFACLVFLGYKNAKALQCTLGYYHGQLMYLKSM